MSRSVSRAIVLCAVLALAGCQDQAAPTESSTRSTLKARVAIDAGTGRYLVVFTAERVPADFGARVAQVGGAVEASLASIGVAAVTGLGEAAAASLATGSDIRNVEPDAAMSFRDDADADVSADQVSELATADATASPASAPFYPRQWNIRAVFAPEAWAAGYLGSRDVVVAILDTGIDYLHPNLIGLVDLDRSKSFVPEEDAAIASRFPGRLPFSDLFWHGTAAASIVASNATVLAGVNRYVTLIAVKVADSTSTGTFGRLLAGIVYAADQGADVISISRGHERERRLDPGFVTAFERAVSYAFRNGALLISLPFNDAADLDHNGDLVRMPCEALNAICVSATAPTGAAGMTGPWDNVDARAPYSAYGRSAVDVAAPGGAGAGFPLLFTKVWLPCTATWTRTSIAPCRTSSVPLERRLAQGIGTSWATPHVAGLAAQLVAQLGHGNPALIRARILQSADDLGDPGADPYYGHGRINIARALGLIP